MVLILAVLLSVSDAVGSPPLELGVKLPGMDGVVGSFDGLMLKIATMKNKQALEHFKLKDYPAALEGFLEAHELARALQRRRDVLGSIDELHWDNFVDVTFIENIKTTA